MCEVYTACAALQNLYCHFTLIMSSYCLNVIYEFNYVVYFHKNALLTPHLHDFDNLYTFVTKFCRHNLRTFSANLLGLKNTFRQRIPFLEV